MSSLTPRFPFSLPPHGSPARLPALLVPLLGGLAVVQLLLPGGISLPPAGAPARLAMPALPGEPGTVSVPPQLARRPLFAPTAGAGAGSTTAAPPDPLGGAIIAGTLRRRGAMLAVVQMPDRSVRYVARGGTVADWRIVGLDHGGARLARPSGETLTVPYGTRAVAAGGQSPNSSAEEEQ